MFSIFRLLPTATIAAIFVALSGCVSTPITSKSADVAADFSRTNNPNGVWSYGWAANLASPFILSSTPRIREGLDSWWGNRVPDGNPGVYYNATGSPIVLGTTTRFEPGKLALHPGPNGEYGLVRWTAPETGNISIAIDFAVGFGRNQNYYHDTTGLTATIMI